MTKETIEQAQQRAERQATQAHRYSVVLRQVLFGNADGTVKYKTGHSSCEVRLYGAERADGGCLLIIQKTPGAEKSIRVVSLEEEQGYWRDWPMPDNASEEQLRMRDTVDQLYGLRNRLVAARLPRAN